MSFGNYLENYNSRINKIYLPTQANQHPSRSIHIARHTNDYSEKIARQMDIAVSLIESHHFNQAWQSMNASTHYLRCS
ncbi:AHH domain-containing protein (plasmid) [Legionella lytica]|uniref:AHH domain-containing protein n=1 Tax=Legionella lytica TaxID=96232 RepID=A0ABY4YDL9_9GAMM|nr:AHH domain-containing protein [Legionella lytica]